jgi:hypothetical protein
MIRLFVRHPVADFPKWRQVYDSFEGERKAMGVVAHAVFQSAENAKDITVWHDFDNLDTARGFAGSPRLREVMTSAGVAGEPVIWFTKPA